jgi:hypothetical protein
VANRFRYTPQIQEFERRRLVWSGIDAFEKEANAIVQEIRGRYSNVLQALVLRVTSPRRRWRVSLRQSWTFTWKISAS